MVPPDTPGVREHVTLADGVDSEMKPNSMVVYRDKDTTHRAIMYTDFGCFMEFKYLDEHNNVRPKQAEEEFNRRCLEHVKSRAKAYHESYHPKLLSWDEIKEKTDEYHRRIEEDEFKSAATGGASASTGPDAASAAGAGPSLRPGMMPVAVKAQRRPAGKGRGAKASGSAPPLDEARESLGLKIQPASDSRTRPTTPVRGSKRGFESLAKGSVGVNAADYGANVDNQWLEVPAEALPYICKFSIAQIFSNMTPMHRTVNGVRISVCTKHICGWALLSHSL